MFMEQEVNSFPVVAAKNYGRKIIQITPGPCGDSAGEN
jgi:hypothetical protein